MIFKIIKFTWYKSFIKLVKITTFLLTKKKTDSLLPISGIRLRMVYKNCATVELSSTRNFLLLKTGNVDSGRFSITTLNFIFYFLNQLYFLII